MARVTEPAVTVAVHAVDAALAAEWDRLAVAGGHSPFLRPGWVVAWADAFAGGRLAAVVVRRGRRLAGVLPVLAGGHRRTGCRLRSPTNGETVRHGMVAEDRRAASELLAGWPAGAARLSASFVADGDPLAAALEAGAPPGLLTLREPLRSSLWLPTEGDDYEAFERSRLSRSRRHNWERRERRLREQGTVRFEVHDGGERLEALLEEGFAVEAAGWKGAQGTAVLTRPDARRFYWGAARWAAGQGLLRLGFLRLDGRPVAFCFALRHGGTVAVPKTGFDPAFSYHAPGVLLVRRLLRSCFEDPTVTRFEFLGEAEDYKRVFTDHQEQQLRLEVLRDSPAGRARRAALGTGRRARRELASRLPIEVRERLDLSSPAGVRYSNQCGNGRRTRRGL